MPSSYLVYTEGSFQSFSLRNLVRYVEFEHGIDVWSARLSTGLFGFTNCKSGNRGPKGYSEVLLALGDYGLNKLIDLGFITCPVCQPENSDGFWDAVKDTVKEKYGLEDIGHFADKKILTFDARRVNWEEILPVTGKAPNRLYVPQGLSQDKVEHLKTRFEKLGVPLPPAGYYDPGAPERFTAYKI